MYAGMRSGKCIVRGIMSAWVCILCSMNNKCDLEGEIRQTDTERETDRHKERETDRHRERETDRDSERYIEREIVR